MNRFILAGIFFTATFAFSQYTCDQTYYLQSATQVMRSGPTSNLSSARKNLKQDLSDIDTLKYAFVMKYAYPLSFKPNCTDTATPASISYWEKDTGQKKLFSKITANYPRIQLYDSTAPLTNHPEYQWWLGFYPTNPSILNYFLGRVKGSNATFENWYGNAYFDDSIRSPSTGLWSDSILYLAETSGPLDSAKLDSNLFIQNGWLSTLADANHRPYLYIQTVKVAFDTSQPAAIQSRMGKAANDFTAWQQGRDLWIQAGTTLATRGEPLELFDMFGRKTAVLYPSGYLYSWNGKTLQGSSAPGGVYFARSGSRILGKFVYAY